MKILHFADTHVGVDNRGSIDPETHINIRTLDILDGIDAMIDMAIEENVDIAVFAGDAFHRHSPAQSYVNEFGKRMLRLRKHCPVVLLVGNHDMPGSDRASALEIYKTLEVEDIIVGKSCELLKIETKSGIVQVVTVPYPSRSWISDKDIKKASTIELSNVLKEETSRRIQALSKEVDNNYPCVLLSHLTVEGCQFSSERSMLISSAEASVTLDDLTLPNWDYVALGHIHKFQDITLGMDGLPPVVYSGSIDRIDFGEEKDPKGFVIVNITNEQVSYEFVDVNARPFKTLDYRVKGKDATRKIVEKIGLSKNLEGAVVRIIITPADDLTRMSVDSAEIREALYSKGVYWINSFSLCRPEDVSDDNVNKRNVIINTSMSKSEMLKNYLQGLEKTDQESKDLMKLFKEISIVCEVENG